MSLTTGSPELQRVEGNFVDKRAEQLKRDCTVGPAIGRIQGSITPGQTFTISGACFGNQPGSVELIGQFKTGTLNLWFSAWKDDEIVAAMPSVSSGTLDQFVALTVIRSDRKRSAAKQASFVASRERVEVPADLWQPSPHFTSKFAHDAGDVRWWARNEEGSPSAFHVLVNPACALDEVVAYATAGDVLQILGWEDGPPYEANVKVKWWAYGRTWGTMEGAAYTVDFQLSATAYCPVGIRIRP